MTSTMEFIKNVGAKAGEAMDSVTNSALKVANLSIEKGLTGLDLKSILNKDGKINFPEGYEKLEIAANIISKNERLFDDISVKTLPGFLKVVQDNKLGPVLTQILGIDISDLNRDEEIKALTLLAMANIYNDHNPSSVLDPSAMNGPYCSIGPDGVESVMVKINGEYTDYSNVDTATYSFLPNSYGNLVKGLIGPDLYDFAPQAEAVADSAPAQGASINPEEEAKQAMAYPAGVQQDESKNSVSLPS